MYNHIMMCNPSEASINRNIHQKWPVSSVLKACGCVTDAYLYVQIKIPVKPSKSMIL